MPGLEFTTVVSKAFETHDDGRGFYSGAIPDFAFNLAMAIIFGIFLIFHAAVFIPYKQWWFGTCFLIAITMETIGYVARVVSNGNIYSEPPFLAQYICLTIAPVFTMAGVYYQLAKLSMVYGPQNSRLKPMTYSYLFIGLDIVSILIQAAGGGIASGNVQDVKRRDTGTHIFVAGLAMQVFSMTVFFGFWFDFLYSIYIRVPKKNPGVPVEELYNPKFAHLRAGRGFRYFPTALTIAVVFVYVRCVYRVAELAEGWTGYLISHEIYFAILDALMMSVGTVILIPFYPGFMFDGRHTNVGVDGFKRSFHKHSRERSAVDEPKEDPSEDCSTEFNIRDDDSKPAYQITT